MDEQNTIKSEQRLSTEGAQWALRAPYANAAERKQLLQWLKLSSSHVKAFLIASSWERELKGALSASKIDVDQLLSGSNVIRVAERMAAGPQRSTACLARTYIAAAAVLVIALALLLPVAVYYWPSNVVSTSIGEQRTISLADGSLVTLNTQSRIRVAYSTHARTIHLKEGQAMFSVAHDAQRPFRVWVNGAVVQALGTKFDIRRSAASTSVAVIEGRVQISPPGREATAPFPATPSTRIGPGQAVNILRQGQLTAPSVVDVASVSAWQRRQLVFRDRTLGGIIAEFNRYHRRPIRIEGMTLAERRYSGVWDTDDPHVFIRYLATQGVSVDERNEALVLYLNDGTAHQP